MTGHRRMLYNIDGKDYTSPLDTIRLEKEYNAAACEADRTENRPQKGGSRA